MVLPARMSGAEKRERMLVMEAAISTAMLHPNIVQVCASSLYWCCAFARGGARVKPQHSQTADFHTRSHAHTQSHNTTHNHKQTYTYTIKPTTDSYTARSIGGELLE